MFFSGGTNTGCGQASSQMGPFYCPADELVYFDLDFLVQMQQQFGATGDLAAQYIVAHEYGHHVQNVLGVSSEVSRAQQQNPGEANRYSVALELQADCFAGAWARSADERGLLEQGEISEALGAAAAVGDDRIQSQAGMTVDPDSFTHGTSEQRVQWFRRGYDTGDPSRCTHVRGAVGRSAAESAVQPLGGADPDPAVPGRGGADRDDPVDGGEDERGVEPGRPHPAESVDEEQEHEGVRDVQREAHGARVAQRPDGERRRDSGRRPT